MTGSSRKTRPVGQRERGHEVRDEDRARCAGARDQREVEEVGDARAEGAQGRDRREHLGRRELVGGLRDPERREQEQAERELARGDLDGREAGHRAAGEEDGDRVAEGGPEHGQGADELAALLDADEQDDTGEADADADEPGAAHRLARVEPGGEHDREDRGGGLDDACEPGVDPRLGEAEQPERQGVVERAEERERPDVGAQSAHAAAQQEERREHGEPDGDAAEGDDRRLELLDRDLDEEERRAPDRREDEQQAEIAPRHRATVDARDHEARGNRRWRLAPGLGCIT